MRGYSEITAQDIYDGKETRTRFYKPTLLVLGFLGVLPGIMLGSLSSAFIDNVLVEKDFDRAPTIISCYFLFTAASFALDYGYAMLIRANARLSEGCGLKYFSVRIQFFTIILNALIVVLLDSLVLIPCAAMLLLIFAAMRFYTLNMRKNISKEAVSGIQTALKICMLFVCGLFVMRGRMTFGELYAVTIFSGAIFTQALELMPQKAKQYQDVAPNIGNVSDIQESFLPLEFLRNILLRKGLIVAVIFLTLIGMLSEGLFLTLQRINLRDCIPSGDWDNLLRNCLFMCGVTLFGFFARRGNGIGFQQIFHGNVPTFIEQRLETISRLVLTISFAFYYSVQIWQYNSLLAVQITTAGLIMCVIFIVLLLSENRRAYWGEDFKILYDMLTKLAVGVLTTYIYCSLSLRVTEISVGDLFVFLVAFQGFFSGIGALGKTALIFVESVKEAKINT